MSKSRAAAAEGSHISAKILTPAETESIGSGGGGGSDGGGDDGDGDGDDGGSSLRVTAKEYLGGAMDLTGEIGRFAVAAATRRDGAVVQCCLSSLYFVQNEVVPLAELAGLGSKCGALRSSISKLEKIMYEQSLVD